MTNTEDANMAKTTSLNVNGRKLPVNVDSQTSLLTVLRDYLNLTGTKYGCGEAQCGACTVLVDGVMTRSCTMPVGKVSGKQITTIEGLETNGQRWSRRDLAALAIRPASSRRVWRLFHPTGICRLRGLRRKDRPTYSSLLQ